MIISSDPFFPTPFSLTDDQQKIADLVVVAAGGPASIVANVIIGALAETEAGQAVLARIQEKKETLGSYIGAAASGLENVDEFTEALGDEQREKNSDFYGSMQGGGDAVVDFVAILAGAKRINKKSGVGDSGSSSQSNQEKNSSSSESTQEPFYTTDVKSSDRETFGSEYSSLSRTHAEALNKVKDANGIPTSRQPEFTMTVKDRDTDQPLQVLIYKNDHGEYIAVRKDNPRKYNDPDGKGDQPPHYNAGKLDNDALARTKNEQELKAAIMNQVNNNTPSLKQHHDVGSVIRGGE